MATAQRHRILTLACATFALFVTAPGLAGADAASDAADAPVELVSADVATTDGESTTTDGDAATTTTIVASEAPQAGAGGLSPEIGPIVVPADGSSFSGAWWLVAFGGLQLIGLFFITRRARARLSTRDAQP